MAVKVTVEKDYDGYFEGRVRRALESVPDCKWEEVVITSGPWRFDYAMSAKRVAKVLHLDFYSALRTGFGHLDQKDIVGVLSLDPEGINK